MPPARVGVSRVRSRAAHFAARSVSEDHRSRFETWPEGYQVLAQLAGLVRRSGLEHSLIELVHVRASQINGCAFCIDMHTKDARAAGETEQRLYALSAWRETPFFTDRERSALAFTEAVTLVAASQVPDSVIEDAGRYFSPDELERLLYVIIEINAWNRLAIMTGRFVPGSYEPQPRS
jgi:AhpD family alkylhydroperoxidase